MNVNNNIKVQKQADSLLFCHVCGDIARGINFNAISCMSCKMFFRRNALRYKNTLRCEQNFRCKITVTSRSTCIACRLKKCFTVGMNPQLIRSFTEQYLPTPQPLSLLRRDRSMLTNEQWNILSNIIHLYDENNPLHRIKSVFDSESILPMKMRVKRSFITRLTQQSVLAAKLIIKRSSHFQTLSIEARQIAIRRNLCLTALFERFILSRQLNFLADPKFVLSVIGLYGLESFKKIVNIYEQIDSNDIIHKVMMFVAIFFSNSLIVIFNPIQDISSTTISLALIQMQNIYVTVLWKYLLYRYGFREAVCRYSSLITTILKVHQILQTLIDLKCYNGFIHKIMDKFEHSLIFER